jgi:hypothetical protein
MIPSFAAPFASCDQLGQYHMIPSSALFVPVLEAIQRRPVPYSVGCCSTSLYPVMRCDAKCRAHWAAFPPSIVDGDHWSETRLSFPLPRNFAISVWRMPLPDTLSPFSGLQGLSIHESTTSLLSHGFGSSAPAVLLRIDWISRSGEKRQNSDLHSDVFLCSSISGSATGWTRSFIRHVVVISRLPVSCHGRVVFSSPHSQRRT